jgi:putative membrane protein
MKKPQIFGKALLGIGVLSLSLGTISCKQEAKPADPKEVAEEENEARFEEAENAEDIAESLVDAAEFDLTQRELGKLAQVNGASADLKSLAKMMETHHDESFKDLSALAKSKAVSVPTAITEDGQKEYDDLKKVEAKDFDKQYLNDVLKDHKKAIDDFSKEAQRTTDVEVKAYLERKVTSLTGHHKSAEDLASKLNIKK